MAPLNPDDPNSPLSWTERILKTSNKIDRATTGALFAATGASAVIGIVGGAWLWTPCAAFGSVLIYRGLKYFEERKIRQIRQQVQIQEQVRIELEAIENSSLPQSQKEFLAKSFGTATFAHHKRKKAT
jgi:hypothetical protein